VQPEITGRLVREMHGVRWRSLLRAGIATAVIVTAMPADAAWFFEPQAVATPLPDPAAIRIKRPTEFVLLAVQFKSCTRHSVRGRARYYWH